MINYIKQSQPKPTNLLRHPPMVSMDYSVYDSVTRQFYRSMYEVWFARCLKAHDIVFQYEPHSFYLDVHYYTPDFYLPEHDFYVECKGLWKKLAKVKVLQLNEIANVILLPSYFQKLLRKYKKWDDKIK